MASTNFSVRMDSDVKKQCEILYGELGMNLTTAINVFLRQSLRVGGFPLRLDWISRIRKPSPRCWKRKELPKIPVSSITPMWKRRFGSSSDES